MSEDNRTNNQQDLINNITIAIENGQNSHVAVPMNKSVYDVHIIAPPNLPCPAVIAVPRGSKHANTIMFDSNNCESSELSDRMTQAASWLKTDSDISCNDPCTICIPILDSKGNGTSPYYQQLSADAVKEGIDIACLDVIACTRDIVKEDTGLKAKDKIVCAGYSSSGCFAQRFALLHPEIVSDVISGGASDCIPVPDEDINYPLGIKNYKELTGHDFDKTAYSKIKFSHYVASGEYDQECSPDDLRYDEDNKIAPMHDMTYMNRSVDAGTGQAYRDKYGREQMERRKNVVSVLQNNYRIDVTSDVLDFPSHYRLLVDETCLVQVQSRYSEAIRHSDMQAQVSSKMKSFNRVCEENASRSMIGYNIEDSQVGF